MWETGGQPRFQAMPKKKVAARSAPNVDRFISMGSVHLGEQDYYDFARGTHWGHDGDTLGDYYVNDIASHAMYCSGTSSARDARARIA